MKCELCDSEATVHELRMVGGKRAERHLCENCARREGLAAQIGVSVPELIEKIVDQAVQGAKPKGEPPRAGTCPACGTTYAEFRQSGLLGCTECYRAFEQALGPLLERAHEGASHHVGKVPKRALAGGRSSGSPDVLGGPEQRAGKIASLRKQLEEAVRAEQYERAATLRDELRRVTELEGTHPGGKAGPERSS